jgi:hypothetical protein
MPVASEKYFTKEHIQSHMFDASPALAEQAIHCLELVTELSFAGLSYQFKGGNSLLVLLQDPKRFSIDVDIATDQTAEAIEAVLDKIIKECGVFQKWSKRQHKTKPWIPLSSYYLFYVSHFSKPEDSFVMLDCQMSKSPYATRTVPVACSDLYSTIVKTDVPTASSLVGDKLLTLGPATLGIPLGKGKGAQRIKHVFDVSLLLNADVALNDIRESFTACIAHENTLQRKAITAKDLLSDTLLFCKTILEHKTLPQVKDTDTNVLAETVIALPSFASHLFSRQYAWGNLCFDIARVGFVMAALCNLDVQNEEFKQALAKTGPDPVQCWKKTLSWLKTEDYA